MAVAAQAYGGLTEGRFFFGVLPPNDRITPFDRKQFCAWRKGQGGDASAFYIPER